LFLTITIDTEEDNWGEYDRPLFSVENIQRVPGLQEVFAAYGVRPTYLITYPVATSRPGIEILGQYRADGLCEIGTHLHPWNTPPIEEERTAANSFVNHLPASLQFRKLTTLHETIAANFGVTPTSFRSGRWGFSDDVARHLIRLGYRVDTSISPAIDWREYGGPDYSRSSPEPFVYRLDALNESSGGSLLEVPATVDFLQAPRHLASAAYRSIKSRVPFGGKVLAALDRLGALNRVSISPELDDAPRMIRLTKVLLERGAKIINMFFHSPTLLERCSPYVRTPADASAFLARIERFLAFAQSAGLRSITMSELTAAAVGASRVQVLHTSRPL
jgi:hypothetical protein